MADDSTTEFRIEIQEGGPLKVTGSVPIQRYSKAQSEDGEPIVWIPGEKLETKKTMTLCRCGQSGNKPFCDGSHNDADFDGNETAPTNGYADRAEELGGRTITVLDDRSICEHAGFCGNEITNIWEMTDGDLDATDEGLMVAMVQQCPSGALALAHRGSAVEPSLPTEIRVVEDGPLWVTGGVPVERADGEAFETRNRMTLCCCGASGNKPLCDGSHNDL